MTLWADETLPYDPERVCPKCGFDRTDDTLGTRWAGAERITRLCLRCKHEWEELPLDHDPVLEAAQAAAHAAWLRDRWAAWGPGGGMPRQPIVEWTWQEIVARRAARVEAAWEHVRSLV